ncbi:MAG: hypothetical protein JHC93_04470 [Parachlamydiales bacterium]|nr:hypothetical protein [Parachlamydiales bacterium]
MGLLDNLKKVYCRFHYPVSLPEDVACALGIQAPNHLSFEEFVQLLQSPEGKPTRLTKFMPRHLAEMAFQSALRKETFKKTSLFSYYFCKGWLAFFLQFDDQHRLRRLYIQHRDLSQGENIEICLPCDSRPTFIHFKELN